MNLLTKIQPYLKLVMYLITSVGTNAVVNVLTGFASPAAIILFVITVIGALAIYQVPNAPLPETPEAPEELEVLPKEVGPRHRSEYEQYNVPAATQNDIKP